MSTSRELYMLTAADLSDPEQAANRLNQMLARLAERVDRLEGLGNAALVRQPLRVRDSDDNLIHSLGT